VSLTVPAPSLEERLERVKMELEEERRKQARGALRTVLIVLALALMLLLAGVLIFVLLR